MRRLLLSAAFFTVFLPGPSPSQAATNLDAQNYHKAFLALDSGHPEHAILYTERGRDPVLNKVLRSAWMAQPGNDVSFAELSSFIAENPDWPNLRGIMMIAEQKIPGDASSEQIVNWFNAHPPLTLVGFYRYVDALEFTGNTSLVAQLIRGKWIDGEFSSDELSAYWGRFSRFLGDDAAYQRLDHLLWRNDGNGARRMYVYVTEPQRLVAEARLALINQTRSVESANAAVPPSMARDPGLMYEKLRWFRKLNRNEEAIAILAHAPEDLVKADAWWEERNIMIRRLMAERNYGLAYELAAAHGLTDHDSKDLLQAEFLAGWLSLRFLNRPEAARDHFQAAYDNATTPISRARGAYWLGRTLEVLGQQPAAEQAYEDAAALNITYYGQLATLKLYDQPVLHATPEPTVPARTRSAFFGRDLIQAVERLTSLKERDRARSYFHAAVEAASQRSDFALLMELAYKIQRPDLAIEAGKAANQRNMMVGVGGFPVLAHGVPQPPEPAFTHAVIRQESMFNPDAESGVGARGLMQLMPRTARDVARLLNIKKFREAKLNSPETNLKLGTAFLQQQLAAFQGSYVLTLVAYNAGSGRAREWILELGDPRDPQVDPIDWIEAIPIAETRNYIQRILEALQIYRARLHGGQARLQIAEDLRR